MSVTAAASWVPGRCHACPPCRQGWPPHATPGSDHAAAWRYLPSVTLRQHLLFLLFPLDFTGSGKGFSVSALLPDSAPKSCSQQ